MRMRNYRFRVNPVYKKELKQSARTSRTAIILLVYNGLMLLFGLFAFYVTFEGDRQLSVSYTDILSVYSIMTGIELGLILLITPMLTAGTIAGEREKQTLDILLTTRLTPEKLISGKLQSALSTILMLVFSSLPVLALVFSVGGVTFRDLAQFIVLIFITSIYIGSMGMFFSVLCRRTTEATIWSYVALAIVLFGTTAVVGVTGILKCMNAEQGDGYYGVFSLYTYYNIGIGPVCLLLINPLLTFAAMVKDQVGGAAMLMGCLEQESRLGNYIVENWLLFSLTLQTIIAAVLLGASARMLRPTGGGRKQRLRRLTSGMR